MLRQSLLEIVEPLTDEDADAGPLQLGYIGAGVLQRLPRRFQEQSLLRIDGLGLARRNSEEVSVELVNVGQIAAVSRNRLARRLRCRIIVTLQVDAPLGNVADAAAALTEQGPELFQIGYPARKSAANPDDGDGSSHARGHITASAPADSSSRGLRVATISATRFKRWGTR